MPVLFFLKTKTKIVWCCRNLCAVRRSEHFHSYFALCSSQNEAYVQTAASSFCFLTASVSTECTLNITMSSKWTPPHNNTICSIQLSSTKTKQPQCVYCTTSESTISFTKFTYLLVYFQYLMFTLLKWQTVRS